MDKLGQGGVVSGGLYSVTVVMKDDRLALSGGGGFHLDDEGNGCWGVWSWRKKYCVDMRVVRLSMAVCVSGVIVGCGVGTNVNPRDNVSI